MRACIACVLHTACVQRGCYANSGFIKLAFHDTDILARILADTSETRDFLTLFLWQAERHADILATILARMSVSASWDASFMQQAFDCARNALVRTGVACKS